MNHVDLIVACAGAVLALSLVAAASVRGWQAWLKLKQAELEFVGVTGQSGSSPAARIELRALKERVRRLEAIADGREG